MPPLTRHPRYAHALVAALMASAAAPAAATQVLASIFAFSAPLPADPDPTLTGVISIDTATGVATDFIPSALGGNFAISDVAIGPNDGLVYLSTLGGTIERYDLSGGLVDNFAFFPGPLGFDGVTSLQFTDAGTLFATTAGGVVAEFDPSGARQADRATGLTFPSGIAVDPSGDLFVATGDVNAPGEILRLSVGSAPQSVFAGADIGGGSGLTLLPAAGDYDGDHDTDADDLALWAQQRGGAGSADGNGDGIVDAADYTIARDNQGAEARLIVTDFAQDASGNELFEINLVTGASGSLTTIPIPIPDPLPPGGIPTNAPSEALLTADGTLLVSTSGPTQRPDNNAALLEFALDGTLLRTIATDLPVLSGIAIVPASSTAVPEPTTAALAALGTTLAAAGRRL